MGDRLTVIEQWQIRVCDCGYPLGATLSVLALINCPDCKRRVVPVEDRTRSVHVTSGAVEALREAVDAARLFNRQGMSWREYDALLARLEHDHLRGQ